MRSGWVEKQMHGLAFENRLGVVTNREKVSLFRIGQIVERVESKWQLTLSLAFKTLFLFSYYYYQHHLHQ